MDPAEPEQPIALPLAATGALAAIKLWAATLSGSSVLFAEAVRSIADFSSQMLMLNGTARSETANRSRDLAFWGLVAPILLYALAAGVVAYEGIDRLNRPRPVTEAPLAYTVLAISLALQTALAWSTRPPAGNAVGMALRLVSTIGGFCAAIALAGLAAADRGSLPDAEGVAALLIAAGMTLVAALLALAVRNMLGTAPQSAAAVDPDSPPSHAPEQTSGMISLRRRRRRRRQ